MNRLFFFRPNTKARTVLVAASLLGSAAMMMNTARADVRIARECADADLRQLSSIEARSKDNRVSGQQLHQAFVALIEARKLCGAEQPDAGIAAYDAIDVTNASSSREALRSR